MMKMMIPLVALGALVLLSSQVFAQAPVGQEEALFEGRLVNIDDAAMTITAANEAGESMEFRYTADTEVTGAVDNLQGLRVQAGATLRISHRLEEGVPVATRIEVTE